MGASETSLEKPKTPFIKPVPGSSGARIRKRDCITVYTDQEVIHLKFYPQMQVADLKLYLQERVGVLYLLYHNDTLLDDSVSLESGGVHEASMLRAVQYNAGAGNLNESSTKSLQCSHAMGSASQSDETFLNYVGKQLDLTKFSVPDIGAIQRRPSHSDSY